MFYNNPPSDMFQLYVLISTFLADTAEDEYLLDPTPKETPVWGVDSCDQAIRAAS
jgi:hypothetical protein